MNAYEGKTVIFVFGSNLAGRHGAGAAKYARDHYGAIYGRGHGLQNRSFAIPTKDWDLNPLGLEEIKIAVNGFITFAQNSEQFRPDIVFRVTRIGCGLAGYKDKDIAPMFEGAPLNCKLPRVWRPFLLTRSWDGFVPLGYH